MLSKTQWLLAQLHRTLWVRASLFTLLGIATALLAPVIAPMLPDELPGSIGDDSVDNLLNILASSMLAVTTFSLTVMVTSYNAASSSVSPRATRLVMADSTTTTVLSTFIGSFLFSLVGLIALSTGIYDNGGRFLLFVMTLVVVALIVIMLLRWIDHLARLGRVGETTKRVEAATAEAMADRLSHPNLGASPLLDERDIPAEAKPVYADRVGYVQHLDMAELSDCVEEWHGEVWVVSAPGAFVHPSRPLAWVRGSPSPAAVKKLADTFTIDDYRSFDQDPRFGLVVLGEIASRSLSSAVNDPGTAIDVIGRSVRLLLRWCEDCDPEDVRFARVWLPPLRLEDLFNDVFTPIARDGAALLEVQIRLQKGLAALANTGNEAVAAQAREHSRRALDRAERALTLKYDFEALCAAAKEI